MKSILTACGLLCGVISFQVMALTGLEMTSLQGLQTDWEKIKYIETNEDQQKNQIKQLAAASSQAMQTFPHSAEIQVWRAIILSTQAGIEGGLGALSLVEQARDHLLAVEKTAPSVLNGSVYTSLGSLYYQVPGWPIGFGDHDKARGYLEKAIQMNPQGMDALYFYADFLIEEKAYQQAIDTLLKAQSAPDRVDRPIADQGRRKEIDLALIKAKDGLTSADDYF